MKTIEALPVGSGARATGQLGDRQRVECLGTRWYYHFVVEAPTLHQRLAQATREDAEAGGVLDFMKDDPLFDDYAD